MQGKKFRDSRINHTVVLIHLTLDELQSSILSFPVEEVFNESLSFDVLDVCAVKCLIGSGVIRVIRR